MKKIKPKNFDDCLIGYDEEVQLRLILIRKEIFSKFPNTEESIRYGMPAFKVGNSDHIYFSLYKKHLGMYPIYRNTKFENDVLKYRGKQTKDALHFLHTEPLPIELIIKLVTYKFNKK